MHILNQKKNVCHASGSNDVMLGTNSHLGPHRNLEELRYQMMVSKLGSKKEGRQSCHSEEEDILTVYCLDVHIQEHI